MATTANIHRSGNGFGYKIKYSGGPYDGWALTLVGAHRRAKRVIRREDRRRRRRQNAVAVVSSIKLDE